MAQVQGVILDVDGTLIDSNAAHAHSWESAFGEHGLHVPYEHIFQAVGMGGDNFLPAVVSIEKDTELGKTLSQRQTEIFKERYLGQVKPFPGARELVQTMHDRGLKLLVASSGKEDEVKALLGIIGVMELIDVLTSASDVQKSKPAPDPIQTALEKAGLSPDAVLMLGDTPYDIESAQKAGVRTIAVRCGGHDDKELSGAVAIYDGPGDLLANYGASPLVQPVG